VYLRASPARARARSSTDYTTTQFATFPVTDDLQAEPFIAGIAAMDPGGYSFLYGIGYDLFNGVFQLVNVYHVDLDGSIALTGQLDLGFDHGPCLQGSTDVSCLVAGEKPALGHQVTFYTVLDADGSSVTLSMGNSTFVSVGGQTFARRGAFMALAGIDPPGSGGDQKIRIFSSGGTLLHTSPAMASYMQFAAIGDGVVYALESDAFSTGNNVYVVSLTTGLLVDTIPTPFPAIQAGIATDEAGNLYLFSPGPVLDPFPVYKWNGSTWATLGDGVGSAVNAISVTGLDIYIGGNFVNAGVDVNADYIAKLDGGTWAALGSTPLTGAVTRPSSMR